MTGTLPESEPPGPEPKAKAKRSREPDADRIPPRAWAAADYLRSRVLDEDPRAAVSRRPWGPEHRSGLRLTWANTFRLMNEQDGREWDEIARTVSWLFKQPPGPRFVVQSPDALRAKWDRIQAHRRNLAAAAAAPPAGRPADTRPPAKFKTWGDK